MTEFTLLYRINRLRTNPEPEAIARLSRSPHLPASRYPSGVFGEIGRALLQQTSKLFRWWHRLRDGTLSPDRTGVVKIVSL